MNLLTTATLNAAAYLRRMRGLAGLSLLAVAAIWGATFFMVKDATSAFPVLAFLALRFAIAAAVLLPLAILHARATGYRPSGLHLRWGLGAGVLFWFGYIFQTFALRLADSGRVGFITGLYVIFVPVLALVLLRYALKIRVVIGAGLALVGMIVLGYAPGSSFVGDLLALLCALSFACHILAVERMPREADWRFMALVQSAVVMGLSLILLPLLAGLRGCDPAQATCAALLPFADPLPTTLPLVVLAVAAFTAIFATAIGLMVQVWAQRILPPSEAALIFALESPFSVVFGVTFGRDALTTAGLIGCGLIFAGTLTATIPGAKDAAPVPVNEPLHEPGAD